MRVHWLFMISIIAFGAGDGTCGTIGGRLGQASVET